MRYANRSRSSTSKVRCFSANLELDPAFALRLVTVPKRSFTMLAIVCAISIMQCFVTSWYDSRLVKVLMLRNDSSFATSLFFGFFSKFLCLLFFLLSVLNSFLGFLLFLFRLLLNFLQLLLLLLGFF